MDLIDNKTSFIGKIFRDNRDFFVPFLVFTVILLVLLGIVGNSQLFLYVNRHNSVVADFVFFYWTNLGDGIIAALFIIFLLWISFRDALTFLVITLLLTYCIRNKPCLIRVADLYILKETK